YVVPNGLAIEVEDRGLGMSAESMEEANARLAVPPDFDPANSSRLGLFVVAKLAARQNIRVGLRRSAYGGLAAVTPLPNATVVPPPVPAHSRPVRAARHLAPCPRTPCSRMTPSWLPQCRHRRSDGDVIGEQAHRGQAAI